MWSRGYFRASQLCHAGVWGGPEGCTTFSDTTTTILVNYSLAQTHVSIKMTTTTMHFGPEWMRKQPTPAPRSSLTESTALVSGLNPTAPTPPASSYSASVASGALHSEKWDIGRPLRYSKEEMIRIYHEGVKMALGPEVERWEAIVREIAADPVGTKEMTDVEKRVSPLRCPSLWRRANSSQLSFHTSSFAKH